MAATRNVSKSELKLDRGHLGWLGIITLTSLQRFRGNVSSNPGYVARSQLVQRTAVMLMASMNIESHWVDCHMNSRIYLISNCQFYSFYLAPFAS